MERPLSTANHEDVRRTLTSRYADLDLSTQQLFLAKAGYWLSLSARETFRPGTDAVDNAPLLRAFSEAHHRIFDQLIGMMAGSDQRYPDDVFANILVDNVVNVRLDPAKLLTLLSASELEKPA